ncbi:dentin sialophosphoprotein [Gadus morhua]|uniref:dentin sialophosphoprotein n=1 Tax=Gadus morhua TaxID=8049 RepID=UPI0011B52FF0|nr:dentin sialophosphoprotein-like [Gadus morhua]
MGRAAGSRSLHDQNPPAPFRHFERGHPVFNTRNIEPKDTVPFRNRHVAAPPDRLSQEEQDKNQIAPPPDPYEIAVEVEALVGPRSPSPTPFKIAESLASTSQRRQGSSYGKGNLSSPQSSSNQQPGRHDASRLGSTLQSRSSSPARGRSPFGRGEGSLSLNTRSFDGGGPERRSRSPSQAPSGRATGSGTLPKNFKSFASSAKSKGTTVSDFKSVLRKSSETNGVLSGRVQDGRSVSPLRKDHSTSGLASFRKTEPLSSISNGQRQLGNSYSSLPPRPDHGGFREVDSSLLARKSYSSTSHSPIRKSGSVTSLSSRSHPGRCGSPIREGYDIESQALLRNPDARNTQNNLEQDNCSFRSARRSNDTMVNHLMSNKTASSSYSRSRVNESRSSSPGRKSHESPGRYLSKNAEPKGPFSDSGRTSPRRTYDSPTKGLKSESGGFARSRNGRSSSPPRRSYEPPVASSLRKTESVTSLNRLGSSTSRTPNAESPGYSILSKITTAESNSHFQRRTTQDSVMSERNSSSRSLRDSTYSSSACRTCSPSRTASSLAHRETSKTTSLHAPRETIKTTSFQAPRETSRPTISQAPRETSNTPSFQAQRETSRTTISQAPRETSNTTSFQAQRETSRTTIAQAPRETSRTTIAQAPRETSNTTSFQAQRETSRTTRFQAPRDTSRTTTLHAPRETRRTTSFQPSNEASRTVGSQGPRETSRSAGFHVTRETSRQGFQESRETSRQGFQGPRETSRTASSVSRPASRSSSVNRFSDSMRGMEERSPSPENHRPFRRTQSPSPPPLIQLQRNTSSQSSMDSWESGGRSGEESGGRSREEYAVLADVPRGRTIHPREEAVKPQNHQAPRGRQELFKPASHSVSRHPSRERDQPGSHHREMLGWGNLSRSHSPTSLFRQGCGPTGEEGTGNTHIPELTQVCPIVCVGCACVCVYVCLLFSV